MRAVLLAPRSRPSAATVDLVAAVVLTVVAQLEVWLGNGNHADDNPLVASIVALLATSSIAVRRRWPLQVGVAVAWAYALQLAVWGDPQIIAASIGWFCALYGLTAWTTPRAFRLGLVLVVVPLPLEVAAPNGPGSQAVFFTAVTVAVMLLIRVVLGDRERRLRLAERERDLAAREAVVDERARIARELHDAIAHDVSLMVVQAGAERHALEGRDGSTHETLHTIEEIGRGALTEMRRLVGLLRTGDGADPLAPQPGIRDLPVLVAQVREAGLPVELSVEGEPRELPVGLELSAYRIVQEALTNALKHAGEARATVHVRYAEESIELEITDDGAGVPPPNTSGGHGLVGMRERVALYGGRFEAARGAAGGFAVRVALPIR
jgi:signal transduction histidine kinase